jgi:hypothetical protein
MRRKDRWILLVVALSVFTLGGSEVAWAAPWAVGLATSSAGEDQGGALPAAAPANPVSVCTGVSPTVKVTWTAVASPAHGNPAISYTVFESTTSASSGYSAAATGITGTSWTSGSLAAGEYWFEVAASYGTNWLGSNSAATTVIIISLGLVCS